MASPYIRNIRDWKIREMVIGFLEGQVCNDVESLVLKLPMRHELLNKREKIDKEHLLVPEEYLSVLVFQVSE